jgi:hypothetical protein
LSIHSKLFSFEFIQSAYTAVAMAEAGEVDSFEKEVDHMRHLAEVFKDSPAEAAYLIKLEKATRTFLKKLGERKNDISGDKLKAGELKVLKMLQLIRDRRPLASM